MTLNRRLLRGMLRVFFYTAEALLFPCARKPVVHTSYRHHYSSDDDRGEPSAVEHRTTSSLLKFSGLPPERLHNAQRHPLPFTEYQVLCNPKANYSLIEYPNPIPHQGGTNSPGFILILHNFATHPQSCTSVCMPSKILI